MSLETFGTFLTLRMKSLLDAGFIERENAQWHLCTSGIDAVWPCGIYIFTSFPAFISMLSSERQDTVCHLWFTHSGTVHSFSQKIN